MPSVSVRGKGQVMDGFIFRYAVGIPSKNTVRTAPLLQKSGTHFQIFGGNKMRNSFELLKAKLLRLESRHNIN